MRIFLTGYMGSGKSTLGKRLAKRLDYDFFDLDDYFEQKYKTSITLFFERFGEEHFRRLEHETLLEVINNYSNIVLACGGGTPCYYNNINLMNQHGFTLYLKLSATALASRLSNSPFRYKRPMLKGLSRKELLAKVTSQLMEREIYYNQSQLIIEVFDLNPESIVRRISESIGEQHEEIQKIQNNEST